MTTMVGRTSCHTTTGIIMSQLTFLLRAGMVDFVHNVWSPRSQTDHRLGPGRDISYNSDSPIVHLIFLPIVFTSHFYSNFYWYISSSSEYYWGMSNFFRRPFIICNGCKNYNCTSTAPPPPVSRKMISPERRLETQFDNPSFDLWKGGLALGKNLLSIVTRPIW